MATEGQSIQQIGLLDDEYSENLSNKVTVQYALQNYVAMRKRIHRIIRTSRYYQPLDEDDVAIDTIEYMATCADYDAYNFANVKISTYVYSIVNICVKRYFTRVSETRKDVDSLGKVLCDSGESQADFTYEDILQQSGTDDKYDKVGLNNIASYVVAAERERYLDSGIDAFMMLYIMVKLDASGRKPISVLSAVLSKPQIECVNAYNELLKVAELHDLGLALINAVDEGIKVLESYLDSGLVSSINKIIKLDGEGVL